VRLSLFWLAVVLIYTIAVSVLTQGEGLAWYLIIPSSLWVFLDAHSIGARRGLVRGLANLAPAGWLLSSLLLWIVAFPVYCFNRQRIKALALPRKGPRHPALRAAFFAILATCVLRLGYDLTWKRQVPAGQPNTVAQPSPANATSEGADIKVSPAVIPAFSSFPHDLALLECYPFDTLEYPPFAAAYRKLATDPTMPDWLRKLEVVAAKNRFLRLKDSRYIVLTGCKPHFCPGNKFVVLFAPDSDDAVGIVTIDGTTRYLGQASEIERTLLHTLLNQDDSGEPAAATGAEPTRPQPPRPKPVRLDNDLTLYEAMFGLRYQGRRIESLERCSWRGDLVFKVVSVVDGWVLYQVDLGSEAPLRLAVVEEPGDYYGEGQMMPGTAYYEITGSTSFRTYSGSTVIIPTARLADPYAEPCRRHPRRQEPEPEQQ
jgi:hypothetical protein